MMSANSELENHFNCAEGLFPFFTVSDLEFKYLNLNISKTSLSYSSVFRDNNIPVKTLSDQLPSFPYQFEVIILIGYQKNLLTFTS